MRQPITTQGSSTCTRRSRCAVHSPSSIGTPSDAGGEVAGAVERGPHELRRHAAVGLAQRSIRHPRRGHHRVIVGRPGEDAQAVAARPRIAADEAVRKGVAAEVDEAARGSERRHVVRCARHPQLQVCRRGGGEQLARPAAVPARRALVTPAADVQWHRLPAVAPTAWCWRSWTGGRPGSRRWPRRWAAEARRDGKLWHVSRR